jgi:hypothetical protein
MSNELEGADAPESPVWLRGLGALLLAILALSIVWTTWIAAQNFARIGV